MPYLKIQTNLQFSEGKRKPVMSKASQLLAKQLGKPESYVMVLMEPGLSMLFGGTSEPTAFLELKSISLPENAVQSLAKALCGFMEEELGVQQERVYIEFSDARGKMWGWNGGTF